MRAADDLIEFTLSAFGGLDIIVNNAGYIWHSADHNMTTMSNGTPCWTSTPVLSSSLACLWALVARLYQTKLAGSQSSQQHLLNHGIHGGALSSPTRQVGGGGRHHQNPGKGEVLQCHSQRSRFWRYRHALNKSLRERTQYIYGEGRKRAK